jgi:hypothetical protein
MKEGILPDQLTSTDSIITLLIIMCNVEVQQRNKVLETSTLGYKLAVFFRDQ